MKTPRSILVPTDLSIKSLEALRYADDLADPNLTEIIVLHALECGSVHHPPKTKSQVETIELEVRKQLILLLAKRKMIRRDMRIEIVWQTPVPAILDAVSRHRVDLVVMSTHGRTGVSRALLGSVAEEVVRCVSVPVLIVKLQEEDSPVMTEENVRHHLHLN